jgi:hypothetical protein
MSYITMLYAIISAVVGWPIEFDSLFARHDPFLVEAPKPF